MLLAAPESSLQYTPRPSARHGLYFTEIFAPGELFRMQSLDGIHPCRPRRRHSRRD